jgi:hypothetical protein
MEILEFSAFMTGDKVIESDFFDKINRFEWDRFRGKSVLVRGCGTAIVPPWAFMVVASRLAHTARRVRYGSEHSSVTVFAGTEPASPPATSA